MARHSIEDTRRFLALLAHPGDVFELRALSKANGQQHTTSGYFDDIEALTRAAIERSGKDDGVYVTINPVNPALLFRAPKNQVRRVGNGDTTSENDVIHRRSLLIDVDPTRPAGISSSDEEHASAIALAREIRGDLAAAGWSEPIFADSGNGAHLIYSVDLPVKDEGLIKRVLVALSKKYSTPKLKIDEKVFNASRISKIYGTLTRKGVDDPQRPHRLARILEVPQALTPISKEALERYAPTTIADVKEKAESAYRGRTDFDLSSWVSEHLPHAKERDWNEGRIWVLKDCPFNDQHDRGEAHISQRHDGMIGAGCKHDSCNWGWKDLYKLLDPERFERRNTKANGAHREPLPDREDVVYEAPDISDAERAEIDAMASRDREPPPPAPPKWKRGPDLPEEIWSRKDDPWVELNLSGDELCRVRAGGIVVVMGGSGSGKSSLVSNLLLQHAKNVGPAIALSIELPADELAARIVGIKTDSTWEDVLRGNIPRKFVDEALAIPRLFVLERKNATLDNLRDCIDAARAEYPSQPVLCAIDYAQLIHSKEREARMRVSDAFERIDDVAREKRVVTIAVSQMGRAGAKMARDGERIGADAADLGAESAAIERFATATLTIGQKGEPREDGSAAVELSLGKGRMSGGDCVYPMTYWGRSGLWRVVGDKQSAADVRASRDSIREEKAAKALEHQLIGAAQKATAPLSREQLCELVAGRKDKKRSAIAALIATGDLVEVARRAPRSRLWTVWTQDRVNATPGLQLVRDMQAGSD